MTTYYVGSGGNDGNDGLTWGNRFLTLNGAEDEPVAANDTVYVGPGVYREMLVIDISGSDGNPITYIGDVTGEHTDGVGGIVRITGSDDDQSATRANCIDNAASSKDYRTFRGFYMDLATDRIINLDHAPIGYIIEDCTLMHYSWGVYITAGNNNTIRRCLFLNGSVALAFFGAVDDTANLVENCIMLNNHGDTITIQENGGGTIKNCAILGGVDGIDVQTALTEGQQWDVNNCIFEKCTNNVMEAVNVGEIVEDYNTIWACGERQQVDTGGNSVTYPAIFNLPILLDGFQFPWWFGELSEWSEVRAITGTGEASDDLLGMARPATASKNSWGAVQFDDISRSGTQKDAGSYSAMLADAGRMQIKVPVTNVSTDISCEVYREVDYAGDNPQMIIKQPGQADDVTTDAAGAEAFNTLTTTLTPAALPPYVIIELVSRNTAAAGDYNIYFDTLAVS